MRIAPYYSNPTLFRKTITQPLTRTSAKAKSEAMKRLQLIISAIMLRRRKSTLMEQAVKDAAKKDKDRGDEAPSPVPEFRLELPPRTVHVVHAEFDPDEREFYDDYAEKQSAKVQKYLKKNIGTFANVLTRILRLRQCSCLSLLHIADVPKVTNHWFLIDRDRRLNAIASASSISSRSPSRAGADGGDVEDDLVDAMEGMDVSACCALCLEP